MASWTAKVAGLFAAHRGPLEAFLARRTGDPQAAGDLAQDVFVRLMRVPDGEAVENPSGFLYTVAGNIALDHGRRAQRRRRHDAGPPDDTLPADTPDAETAAAGRETFAHLHAAIDTLPPKTRTVFLLYHVEGLSYRAIAGRLDISPRTVEYHLRQALEHCRRRLGASRGGR